VSVTADHLAALQYVQAWTAHVDLEICKPDGDLVLRRRRVSVFVRSPVTVVFRANEMLGQEPILPPPAPGSRRLAVPPKGPRSGWAVTCPSPVELVKVVIRHNVTGYEQSIWNRHDLAGVNRGSVIIPLDHTIEFTLKREREWIETVKEMMKVSENA